VFGLNSKFFGMKTRHSWLEAALVALILTVAIFPDVIFKGASLRLTDQIAGSEQNLSIKSFYFPASYVRWWGGYNDNGGATFQAEPMIEFMKYCIKNGESPYWNPYSAAGSLGPEALVDQKFSVLTLLNAVLDGGSGTYNIVLLLLYYLAIFFLYRTVRECLELSAIAGVGAAIFYVLNGYSSANFGSNVTQNYLYVPMCLYCSLIFLKKPTSAKFVAVAFSFAALLSCTFIPTTITSLFAIYGIILGYLWVRVGDGRLTYRSATGLILVQGGGVVLSILLLAVLYFPILENIRSLGTLDEYSTRIFWPLYYPQAISSLFSSTTFFESYNAMEQAAKYWRGGSTPITGNTVFHMGIIAITLIGCAFSRANNKYNRLVIVSILCIVLIFLRLFDVRYFAGAISLIPVIGKIGCQYWWPGIVVPAMILVGFGIHNVSQDEPIIWPALLFLVFGASAVIQLYKIFGFGEPHITLKLIALVLFGVVTAGAFFLLLIKRLCRDRYAVGHSIALIFVFGLFIELMFDGKIVRFQRNDLFSTPPGAVNFVQRNAGINRSLNFGQAGLYPELGSALQIQEVTSMNQGVLLNYQEYFYSAINLDNSQRLGYNVTTPRGAFPTLLLVQDKPASNKFDWSALNLLGVKYVLLPANFPTYASELVQNGLQLVYQTPATSVFENPNALPRAFSVTLPGAVADTDFTLPSDFPAHIQPATVSAYHNAEVELSGTAANDSLVVLSDNWHKSWSASVNGKPTIIARVNGTFRGVVVAKGDYVIRMSYRPYTLSIAILVSVGILIVLALILVGCKRVDGMVYRKWQAIG